MSFLHDLESIIADRKNNPRPDSYTAELFAAGENVIVKKVGEEAVEVILAVKGQGNERVISEVADLMYHTLVLLAARGLTLEQVEAELVIRDRIAQYALRVTFALVIACNSISLTWMRS